MAAAASSVTATIRSSVVQGASGAHAHRVPPGADDERAVRAAEGEGVHEDDVDVHLARLVRDVVEVALGIGVVDVDRRRDDAVAHRARAPASTLSAPAAQVVWPVIDFGEVTTSRRACVAEHALDRDRLGHVAGRACWCRARRRSRSSSGVRPASRSALRHRQDAPAAVGRRVGHPVARSGSSRSRRTSARIVAPRARARVELLEHDDTRALAEHEARAVARRTAATRARGRRCTRSSGRRGARSRARRTSVVSASKPPATIDLRVAVLDQPERLADRVRRGGARGADAHHRPARRRRSVPIRAGRRSGLLEQRRTGGLRYSSRPSRWSRMQNASENSCSSGRGRRMPPIATPHARAAYVPGSSPALRRPRPRPRRRSGRPGGGATRRGSGSCERSKSSTMPAICTGNVLASKS